MVRDEEEVAGAKSFGGGRGVGKRRHGKPQLRVDEARRWLTKAVELADSGEAGAAAAAALLAFVMGMRASEIVNRVVRDFDDDAKLLWIPDSKTEAGRRTLQVPTILQPLMKQIAHGKSPAAMLFGHHWRDWVRKWVKRICEAAGVPKVTAHFEVSTAPSPGRVNAAGCPHRLGVKLRG